MSAPFLQLSARSAVISIALFAASSFADTGSSDSSITDDAAVFRQHAKLKAELDAEANALQRETGVITLLKTVAFATGDTTAGLARHMAETETQSAEHPVAVMLYIRGSRSAGIGSNAAFDAIVPAFELASLPSQASDEDTDPVKQIADTYRRLLVLVRHYSSQSAQTRAGKSPASARSAELWLLAAVLAVSAAIVGTCARCSRHKKTSS